MTSNPKLSIKDKISGVLFVVIFVGIIGNIFYQNHLENIQKQQKIEVLQKQVKNYELMRSTCVNGNEIFPIIYQNNPRSQERIEQVAQKFAKLISAPCFVFQSDKIYTNPYSQVDLSELQSSTTNRIESEIYQGILYEVDKGIPFLITGGSICADGSYSASVGRGTCSWHGGYASQRGSIFEFNESIYEYDPRKELEELKD